MVMYSVHEGHRQDISISKKMFRPNEMRELMKTARQNRIISQLSNSPAAKVAQSRGKTLARFDNVERVCRAKKMTPFPRKRRAHEGPRGLGIPQIVP